MTRLLISLLTTCDRVSSALGLLVVVCVSACGSRVVACGEQVNRCIMAVSVLVLSRLLLRLLATGRWQCIGTGFLVSCVCSAVSVLCGWLQCLRYLGAVL